MNDNKKLFVADFNTVEKHYTRMEFLDIIIDILENTIIPQNLNFDMSEWGESLGGVLEHYESFEEYQKNIHQCGTTCCVLGWAASDKRLTEKGLCLDSEFSLSVNKEGELLHTYFEADTLKDITGMEGGELIMLFGSDSDERLHAAYEWLGEEFEESLPVHIKEDVNDPQLALEAMYWYKEKLLAVEVERVNT